MKTIVKKEWLCNEETGEIIKMPLRWWFKNYEIKLKMRGTFEGYQSAKLNPKSVNNFLEIYRRGGYGIAHNEIDSYMDKIFYFGNADLDEGKLVECPYSITI